jgi:hypothetical protein
MILYFYRNVDRYPYCADTKRDMLGILKANSSEEINKIFDQIKMRNEDGIQSKYIIFCSIRLIIMLIVLIYANLFFFRLARILSNTMVDTNIAESAHAMINRTGKSLKLKMAFLR